MSFKEYPENNYITDKIERDCKEGHLAHAYIIEAPWHFNKEQFALDFAKAILCKKEPGRGCDNCPTCKKIDGKNHIDMTFVEASAKGTSKLLSVKDEDIARVQQRLSKSPMEADRNIAIIKDADTMSIKAFNRFLKTLEEPAFGTIIFLLSENINNLPKTIQSRCVHLRPTFRQVERDQKRDSTALKIITALEKGEAYHTIKEEVEIFSKDRAEAFVLIDSMEDCWLEKTKESNSPKMRREAYAGMKAMEDTRDEIKRGNNTGFALKKMILTIGGK